MSMPLVWCVVPAAGRGTRVGGDCPKQYLPLGGRPLIEHTLQRLAAHPQIAGLLVTLAAADGHWPGITSLSGKPVLTAMGLDPERALGAVRLSLGRWTTGEDIDLAVEEIVRAVARS